MMSSSECGVRCFTERKSYCRDLHRWGKNLLYMIGLECVAQQLAEPRQWPHISPFILHHDAAVDDWDSSDLCPVCAGKRYSAIPQEEAAVEQTWPRTDSSISSSDAVVPKLNFDFLFAPSTTVHSAFANSLPTLFSLGPTSYLHQLLQWSTVMNQSLYGSQSLLPAPLPPPNNYEKAVYSSLRPAQNTQKSTAEESVISEMAAADEPLDLSKKNSRSKAGGPTPPRPPDSFHSAPSAAVQDFLNNHSAQRQSPSKSNRTVETPVSNAATNGTGKRNYSQSDLEKAVKDIRSGRLGTRRASVVYGIPRSTLRNKIYKLEASEDKGATPSCKRSRRSGIAISTSPIGNGKVDPEEDLESVTPTHSAASVESAEAPESVAQLKNRLLGQLAQDQAAKLWDDHGAFSGAWRGHLDMWSGKSPLINSLISGAARTAFASRWPEYLLQINAPPDNSLHQLPKSLPHVSTTELASVKDSKTCSSRTKDIDQGWRKTRPKRGQYRKYDKNALDKAVLSVRRGEMSVHRAGSYYGVPHSTLEYKVKERNLLRAKKKEAKKAQDETDADAQGESEASPSRSPRSQEKESAEKSEAASPSSGGEKASPCRNGSAASSETEMTETPSAFFASEMMRRLQAEARPSPDAGNNQGCATQ